MLIHPTMKNLSSFTRPHPIRSSSHRIFELQTWMRFDSCGRGQDSQWKATFNHFQWLFLSQSQHLASEDLKRAILLWSILLWSIDLYFYDHFWPFLELVGPRSLLVVAVWKRTASTSFGFYRRKKKSYKSETTWGLVNDLMFHLTISVQTCTIHADKSLMLSYWSDLSPSVPAVDSCEVKVGSCCPYVIACCLNCSVHC